MGTFATEHYDDLEGFWSRLQPHDWAPRREWLFRGVDDAAHGLVPSALRRVPSVADVLGPASARMTHRQQVAAELGVLRRFHAYADALALPLPDSTGLFEQGNSLASEVEDAMNANRPWPLPRLHYLCSLAQHHGLPTRLLDWSRKPLIAAYFAAASVPKEHAEGRLIAVWCLRHRDGDRSLLREAEVVTSPRHVNTNVHLQSGKFTVHDHRGAPADAPPLETIVEQLGTDVILRKLTFPASKADKLMRRLAEHFVHAGAIYAGYAGAAAAVRERVRFGP